MTRKVPQCTPERMRHDWWAARDGLWRVGGVVSVADRCTHCGCRRVTITGDVDRPSRNGVLYLNKEGD